MQRINKSRVATQTKTEMKQDRWALIARAPIRKEKWWQFWKPVVIRVGLKVFTVSEFAEVLTRGVPELTNLKAMQAASELVDSAMVNDVGTAVVISATQQEADRHRMRLAAQCPDLTLTVEAMD